MKKRLLTGVLGGVAIFALFVLWVATAADPIPPKGMILIPAGTFLMGADEAFLREELHEQIWSGYEGEYINEVPGHTIYLKNFFIDQYPVTVAQFNTFLYASKRMNISPTLLAVMEEARKKTALNNSPVIGVDWFEARDYAIWAGKQLPLESQWEKAARGDDGRLYPWGKQFDKTITEAFSRVAAIRKETFNNQFLPVTHPSLAFDSSPYGVRLLANPPAEWTASPYQGYAGNKHFDKAYGKQYNIGTKERPFQTPAYIIKKAETDILGQNYKNPHYIRYCLITTFRGYATPQYQEKLVGFRTVKVAKRTGMRGKLLDAWQNWQQNSSLGSLYQQQK